MPITNPKDGTPFVVKNNLQILVDEFSTASFAKWFEHKDDMIKPTCELFQKRSDKGRRVDHVRCDDAGENKFLKKRLASVDWKLGAMFEHTPRDTPQLSRGSELKLFHLPSKARAMMGAGSVPKKHRFRTFVLAIEMASVLDWLVLVKKCTTEKCQIQWFGEDVPAFAVWCSRCRED